MAKVESEVVQTAATVPAPAGPEKWMLVLLQVEGGTVSLLCKSINDDPVFPDKKMLAGIFGMYWPFGSVHMQVEHWSVPKNLILNWMVGTIKPGTPLTPGLLNEESKPIPRLPGTTPHSPLASDTDVSAMVALQQARAEKAAEPKPDEGKPKK